MRIVMTSYHYSPSVGGIETVSALLAAGLGARGHDVVTLTETPSAEPEPGVLRRPSLPTAWRAVRGADVVLQSNISLRWLWIPLLLRIPVVVVSHTWLRRPHGGRLGWQDHLKRRALRYVQVNAAVSAALARDIGPTCTVVPNPYDSKLFRHRPESDERRRADLLFLGRLVSDKGCDLAVSTLAAIRQSGKDARLTVIGTGPEAGALAAQARELGVEQFVRFRGVLRGADLVREMHGHRVLLTCSRWEEPFGLVVLEGLACGLTPVIPDRGGLPEAAGEFGCIYKHGDPDSLVEATLRALEVDPDEPGLTRARKHHLSKHHADTVVAAYESVLSHAVRTL